MEPDYFGSFLQSRWLSIFVVHEIQLRLRCIMESANGSLTVRTTKIERPRIRLRR